MSRINKPRAFSLDPKTESMLNVILQERPETTASALIRRLIAREYRSHMARKRLSTPKPQPEGETSNDQ